MVGSDERIIMIMCARIGGAASHFSDPQHTHTVEKRSLMFLRRLQLNANTQTDTQPTHTHTRVTHPAMAAAPATSIYLLRISKYLN